MAHREKGAAVVMAMFIVVLCTLAVSPLIWTLFATSKSISVDSARSQTQAVSLSGLDWARVILREDARVSSTDNLTEPWAVPLAESRLSEGLMRRGENVSNLEDRDARLQGQIEDAQSKFNLRNLGGDVSTRDQWLIAFDRLCSLLGISPVQRTTVEEALLQMYPKPQQDETSDRQQKAPPVIPALTWQEFNGQFGISEQTWNQLVPVVTVLPSATTINVNTAGPEVIYAAIDELSFGGAQAVVRYRERVTFNNLNDLRAVIDDNITLNNALIGVASNFFFVQGQAQVRDAVIRTQAMLERSNGRVYVLWRQD